MPWFAIPDLNSRQPVTLQTFATVFLPVLLVYHVAAFFAVLPNAFLARRAVIPVFVWLAWRAVTRLDLSNGDPELAYLNFALCLGSIVMVMRQVEWAFCSDTWKRSNGSSYGSEKTDSDAVNYRSLISDALDLVGNMRGFGWEFSRGLPFPPDPRPTHSKTAFIGATLLALIKDYLVADLFRYGIAYFYPDIGSAQGASIFDPALPPVLRFLQACAISVAAGVCIYFTMQWEYELPTVLGVALGGQKPEEWPPLYNAPWKCTSLSDFWSKGWHHLFRSQFVNLGAKPFGRVFGRAGGIMGAFLVSAALHTAGLWGFGRGTDFLHMGVPFVMMGVGIILEKVFTRITGKGVGGFWGWLWTMVWLTCWFTLMAEAFCIKGMVISKTLPRRWQPARNLFSLTEKVLRR